MRGAANAPGGSAARKAGPWPERDSGERGKRRRDWPPRPACGGRGIAGQGEDDRGLARPVMPGDGDPGPCLGPAVEGGLGEAGGRLRHALRDRAAGGPDARLDRPGAGGRRRAGARHRPGPGGRGDRLAGSGLAGATGRNRRQEGRARNLPRGDRGSGPGGARQPPRHRHGPGPGLAGAAGAGLPGRLWPVAGAVAQAAGLPLGGPGAVGGAAPDLRARGRDRGVRAAAVLDRGGGSGGEGRRFLRRDAGWARRNRCRGVGPRVRAERAGGGGAHPGGAVPGGRGRARHPAPAAQPAIRDRDPAAGGVPPARPRGRRDHGDRPAALRGRRPRRRDHRADHLSAHRFDRDGGVRRRPGARGDRGAVRRGLRAGPGADLPDPGAQRAGGP